MRSLLTALAILLLIDSHAQPDITKLDSFLNVLDDRGLATGSVAISLNESIIYKRAVGFAMRDSNNAIAANTGTKYRIGSVSKMFTAVMTLQLLEKGQLKLDERLAKFFPQLPNAEKINIRHLLYHRSGLHDYTRDTNFPDWMDTPKTREEMLNIITDKGSDFEPDTKAEYCNTNYLLLSYLIEDICKMPYAKVLQKKITSVVELKNTYYAKALDIKDNEASSYKYSEGSWKKEKQTNASIHSGAGSIVSTPADLVLFIRALFNEKLISRANLDSMKTMIDNYGMGMFPYNLDTIRGYGHNGRIEEFYSAVRYYPSKKMAISYVANGILYPRSDILDGILKICFDQDYTIPFATSVALQDNDTEKYTGTWSSGDLPFKVLCKQKDGKLIFEAAGRTMDAEPVSANYFGNLSSGTFFELHPEKDELLIKETDNTYHLRKEK